jgi:AraC family transcriptional regulator
MGKGGGTDDLCSAARPPHGYQRQGTPRRDRRTGVAPLASADGVTHPCCAPSATGAWVHASYTSRQAERVTIVPSLFANDPLLHHIALLLQTTIAAEGVAEQLYASVLADALVIHFLRRYTASRPPMRQASGGLAPSKLRRMIAYIQDHLEQTLSLATLATVAQTSPAHFARLFKQATGRTPHQYVITCRMAYAKRLLVETDMPLSEVAPQVGCADQSHFTALFRKHVSMTPLVYRNTTQL